MQTRAGALNAVLERRKLEGAGFAVSRREVRPSPHHLTVDVTRARCEMLGSGFVVEDVVVGGRRVRDGWR